MLALSKYLKDGNEVKRGDIVFFENSTPLLVESVKENYKVDLYNQTESYTIYGYVSVSERAEPKFVAACSTRLYTHPLALLQPR